MSTLPPDVIAEILSFLPPKSLYRFKSVAKSWHFLITSDAFIKLHLTKTLISQLPNLIICRDDSLSSAAISAGKPNEFIFSAVDHPVKHLPKHATVKFIGSCRGILCISDRYRKTVFFFNPSTKTRRLIPPAPTKIPADDHPEFTNFVPYVYKPIDHVIAFGFGYDSSVDDFKLLRMIECYEIRVQHYREVRLYSMRSNSWKIVEDDFDDYPVQQMDAVHINGVLYFAVSDENHVPCVKCFDIKTEKFSVFSVFECDNSFDKFSLGFFELGGCFAVLANYLIEDLFVEFGWRLACAELRVRKGVSWVKVFRLSDPFKIGSLTHIRPLVYSKDGERVLLEVDESKFCWFDWRSNEFTRVKACGLPPNDSRFDTYTFVPSIVSLRSDEDKAKDERKGKGNVVPKKNVTQIINKKNMDGFLSTGFKLRL